MLRQFLIPLLYYKYLSSQLILRDIKGRYKQSILGYAWIVFNPLVQLLVYSFVFSVIFKFETNEVPYSIFLFVGLLPWIYFQTSLTASALVLVDNSNLLKKVSFPREVLPYSIVFSKSVDLFFSLFLLAIFLMFFKLPIPLSVFYIIPLFILQVILMLGLSLFLSAANLFYRDIQYVTNLMLLMWMYLTPVVYPISLVPENYLWLYKLNPMVGIIEGYRSAVFNTSFDSSSILLSVLISISVFLIGFFIFKKGERVFADIV
ncbi:ABC transporter permease [Candidatus Daviesbacteria bacterium]|nr:ABC transporter permease [Candidatus Daviesbacteria bacterium]